MSKLIEKFKNKLHYSIESIHNRYPCKLIKIKHAGDFKKNSRVIYRAVTKLNIRECSIKEVLDDTSLVEKIHPTDCIKLGFIALGDILLKECSSIEEAQTKYKQIINEMLKDMTGDDS
jgi:hypothetical protein